MLHLEQNNRKVGMAFIDGFNVYHFLQEYHSWSKWLDYRKLAQAILPKYVDLTSVFYFSAYAHWNQGKVARHQHYVQALKTQGVTPIISKFQNRERGFILPDNSSTDYFQTAVGKICGRKVRGYVHEEKQTDVSIATTIIAMAAKNRFDIALLISGDTDFIPVITTLREHFPEKKIMMAVPSLDMPQPFLQLLPNGYCRLITANHLKRAQLDDPILRPGSTDLTCPAQWKA